MDQIWQLDFSADVTVPLFENQKTLNHECCFFEKTISRDVIDDQIAFLIVTLMLGSDFEHSCAKRSVFLREEETASDRTFPI